MIPPGSESPGMDASTRRWLLTQEIHRAVASERQILTRMVQVYA